MEDDVMVWFSQLITISAAFWMIKSPVSFPPCRLFWIEQLRLCFVKFGSGIIQALGSVDAVYLVDAVSGTEVQGEKGSS